MGLDVTGIGAVAGLADTVLKRFFPDKTESELTQIRGAFQTIFQIHETNKVEAAHKSIFVAGWRPAVGWVSVCGLTYESIVRPMITWLSLNFGLEPPPSINTDLFMTLLLSMLGVAGLRTFEKVKGVARNNLNEKIPTPGTTAPDDFD